MSTDSDAGSDGEMEKINVRVPQSLLAQVDEAWEVRGYATKSDFIRDALTPMGVTPFGDNRHYSYNLWNADSILGNYGLLVVGILAASAALAVGDGLHSVVGPYL